MESRVTYPKRSASDYTLKNSLHTLNNLDQRAAECSAHVRLRQEASQRGEALGGRRDRNCPILRNNGAMRSVAIKINLKML
jgi:hypothetical protein